MKKIVYCLIAGTLMFSSCDSPEISKETCRTTAWVLSQDAVKDRLKVPSTAKFPEMDSSFVSSHDSIYTVHAYVDAQNTFGATMRSEYSCEFTYKGGEETDAKNWRLEYCHIKE